MLMWKVNYGIKIVIHQLKRRIPLYFRRNFTQKQRSIQTLHEDENQDLSWIQIITHTTTLLSAAHQPNNRENYLFRLAKKGLLTRIAAHYKQK
jgi:hypothetical protein